MKRAPLFLFLYGLGVNLLLAYGTESLGLKLLGGCLLVFLPFGWVIHRGWRDPAGNEKLWERELFPAPARLWVPVLLLLVLLSRLAGLQSLSAWPMPDEATFNYFSIKLSQQWDWRFFFTQVQTPPFFNWCLAWFFKLLEPGLLSLWLFPALVSILTFLTAAVASCRAFSTSFSFLVLGLTALDFWLMYTGRFCMPIGTSFLWEVLVFLVLVFFLKAPSPRARMRAAWFLGLGLGLGVLVTPFWVLVAGMVLFPVWKDRTASAGAKTVVFALTTLAALVFLGISWTEHNGSYLFRVLGPALREEGRKAWWDPAADMTALLWGTPWKSFYGPLWGGALNPVAGALFLLGTLECFRARRSPFIQWIGLGFLLFYAPVFVLRNFEYFRVLGAWPFVLLVCALGSASFLRSLPTKHRLPVAWVVLCLSSGLDLYHLAGPYHRLWGTPGAHWSQLKSLESWKAHGILEAIRAQQGEGLLLCDLRTLVTDQTLPIAQYARDPGSRPDLTLQDKTWVALILDAHFKSFLEPRFPHGRWFWLGQGPQTGVGLSLWLLPLEPGNRALLEKWVEADRLMAQVTREEMDHWWEKGPDRALERLHQVRPFFQGDPFLETCFWSRVLYHEKSLGDPRAGLEAARQGSRLGYPLPPLLNDEGVFLMREGRYPEARRAFNQALRSPLDLTRARENRAQLDLLEKR